jgi:hypothetical protein
MEAEFRAALDAHFSWLRPLSYDGPVVSFDRGGLLGDMMRGAFSSPSRELAFDLQVEPAPLPGARKGHLLLVHIYRRPPTASADDSLFVDWYAAVHRRDLADRLVALADAPSPLMAFVQEAIPLYSSLLQQDLYDVLAAKTWIGGTGDPEIPRLFDFLVRDFGFSPPVGKQAGIQILHIYRRGEDHVTVSWEGSDSLSVAVRGESRTIDGLQPREAAAFLTAHPEVLAGNFTALDVLIDQRKS